LGRKGSTSTWKKSINKIGVKSDLKDKSGHGQSVQLEVRWLEWRDIKEEKKMIFSTERARFGKSRAEGKRGK